MRGRESPTLWVTTTPQVFGLRRQVYQARCVCPKASGPEARRPGPARHAHRQPHRRAQPQAVPRLRSGRPVHRRPRLPPRHQSAAGSQRRPPRSPRSAAQRASSTTCSRPSPSRSRRSRSTASSWPPSRPPVRPRASGCSSCRPSRPSSTARLARPHPSRLPSNPHSPGDPALSLTLNPDTGLTVGGGMDSGGSPQSETSAG
jgi:hypothetical protein